MKKALDDLSKDSIAQRAGLRMEDAPTISRSLNKDKGLVFDFSKVPGEFIHDVAESSSHTEGQRKRPNTGSALMIVVQQNQGRYQSHEGMENVSKQVTNTMEHNKMKETLSV